SQTKLPGAKILLIHDSLFVGVISDSSGRFELKKVPVGRQSFKVSFIGYEDYFLTEVPISSGRQLNFEIELKESLKTLNVIEVTVNKNDPINSMATVSARVFSIDETSRFAGSFNDPARMAQSFAGVSTTGDLTNELVIRGNSSRGVLWRIEGIEIPNPNHFRSGEGSTGGGISILSSNMLANSDFYTGAFPAEYGNATSGVFDMRLRKGNVQKREYSVELGVLGAEVSLEGPFSRKSKSSYLIGYRYSTLDILDRLGINIAGDIVPTYQDLAFNFSFPTKKAGDFTLFGIGGLSKAVLTADKDSLLWQSFNDREEDLNIQKTGVVGITHLFRLPNKKAYLKSIVSCNASSSSDKEGYLDDDYEYVILRNRVYDYPVLRGSVLFNTKLNRRNSVRAGVIYSYTAFKLLREDYYYVPDTVITELNTLGNTGSIQAYGQWKRRYGENIELHLGSHFTYFLLNDNFSVDPRFGFQWKLRPRHTITAGSGLHSKIEAISIYMAEQTQTNGEITNPNRDLDLTKAFHAVIGYDFSMTKNMHIKTELYYQRLFNVPILDSVSTVSAVNFSAGFTNLDLSNKGTGYNYGLELTFEKFMSRGWFFLVTASFFNSRYVAGDGIERNTAYNNNYLTNLVAGKEFTLGEKKNQILGFNGRLIWKGGNRVAPIDLDSSKAVGWTVFVIDEIYEDRLSDYFRFDFNISYRVNCPKFAYVFIIDIQNVTNRLNVGNEYFDSYTNQIEVTTQLGILPILKFKFEF
ncbi:TonB-dependent receptor, partial [Crocinitomix catalasitica]|nr:TonB-dependent receptor [Crocinitomix catalasitica]